MPGLERFRHAATGVALAAPARRTAVRAYLWRDTGTAAPHLNRFPAAPFCTLTWFLSGTVHDGVSAAAPPLAACVVGGPFTRPAATFSAGRVRAFTVVFFPDAFARLTGLAPAGLADRLVPATSVLPKAWHSLLAQVAGAGSDRARVDRVDAFLAAQLGDAQEPAGRSWLRRLREAAGIDRLGERQVERNIRQAAGQTLRALRRGERFESALLHARAAAECGGLDWARLASDTGYADQPHLSRECRKLSGTSPADLIARQQGDESYWIYRFWR